MLDIITIGDAAVDVFLNLDEATVKCELKTEHCQICFDYGDKIPVKNMRRILGCGNASNFAVGSARLKMKTAIVSILGNDEVAEHILKNWRKEKLDTSFVTIDKKRATNYSTILNYKNERTIFVFHEVRDYKFPKKLPESTWLYYTSMGSGSESMQTKLLKHVQKSKTKLVFQPGTFQLKLGLEALKPIIAASFATIVNKQEAERLLNEDTSDIKILLSKLHQLGTKIAVITDGPKGAYAYDGRQFLFMPIFDVPIIERTGCGDAFATGLIAGLHHDETMAEAMRWGTANSAGVLGFIGPQKGLLDKNAMKKMLKQFQHITAKIIWW